MTPAAQLPPFVKGADGRHTSGPYTISPARLGFGIEAAEVFRFGVHVHRCTGPRCMPEAEAWARDDAAVLGVEDKGQSSLLLLADSCAARNTGRPS